MGYPTGLFDGPSTILTAIKAMRDQNPDHFQLSIRMRSGDMKKHRKLRSVFTDGIEVDDGDGEFSQFIPLHAIDCLIPGCS